MSFRKELKSIMFKSKINLLKKWIDQNDGKILYPERNINSIYFDNKNLAMYHDAVEGSVPRKKIRVRNYNNRPVFNLGKNKLELKISSAEGRFKEIKDLNIVSLFNYKINDLNYGPCYPVVCVTYKRIYYYIKGVRLTIDSNITYRKLFFGEISNYYLVEPYNVIEIKYKNPKYDNLIKSFPFHFVRFSKYSQAIESRKYKYGV